MPKRAGASRWPPTAMCSSPHSTRDRNRRGRNSRATSMQSNTVSGRPGDTAGIAAPWPGQTTPTKTCIRSPWGGIPGYTSVMIRSFNRPEETAWLLGGTADLSGWGAPGLSVNVKYIDGDTPDCGSSASPDQNEWDVNLDYSPPQPLLAGLGLRLRFGWLNQKNSCNGQDARDTADIRLILNYAFDL